MHFDIIFVFKLIFFVPARYPQGEDLVVTSPQSSTFVTKIRPRSLLTMHVLICHFISKISEFFELITQLVTYVTIGAPARILFTE